MRYTAIILALSLVTGAAAAGDPVRQVDAYVPPKPKEGYSYPDCYCTDSTGQRVEVGQTACLQIGSKQVTSRCEKARNLVIWRHQAEGCSPGV